VRTSNKIPKIIHYCWFGGKEKPELVKRCMGSWKKHLNDYEFIEWNEDNVDFNSNQYASEALKAKKFAFVSDYVRVYALYHYGGIYLDTDVVVFKPFDTLLGHDSFWGFEQENFVATSTIGAAKGNRLIREFLDLYKDRSFISENGTFDDLTNVSLVTKMFQDMGLKTNGELQRIGNENNLIYPQLFFSPYDYINCRNIKTEDTFTKHHFYKSWLPLDARLKSNLKGVLAKLIGGNNIARLRKLI
jgi:hypothetical protein